jgi:antitoxin HicB
MMDYPFTIRKLSKEDGGGYLAEAFDLKGCMSDGETIEEAAYNLQDAIQGWIEATKELGLPIPPPSEDQNYSGKWVVRTPKSLHRKLSELSKQEGVSLNTLTVTLLAEGLGHRAA